MEDGALPAPVCALLRAQVRTVHSRRETSPWTGSEAFARRLVRSLDGEVHRRARAVVGGSSRRWHTLSRFYHYTHYTPLSVFSVALESTQLSCGSGKTGQAAEALRLDDKPSRRQEVEQGPLRPLATAVATEGRRRELELAPTCCCRTLPHGSHRK